jgi:hypothetical protein
MKIIERTVNTETGETVDIERDETAAEKKERETAEKEIAARRADDEAKTTAKAALLSKLGITAEEVVLLFS